MKYGSIACGVLLLMCAACGGTPDRASQPVRAEAEVVNDANMEKFQNPVLKRFYKEVQTLMQKYYPAATSHLLKDNIHFEHDTQLFVLRTGDMTGKLQDPHDRRGPKAGGILCDISLVKGEYHGQAGVPQTFDEHYFEVLLMAPYSAKHDAHLFVSLSYPKDAKEEFCKEFKKLMNDFATHIDGKDIHFEKRIE